MFHVKHLIVDRHSSAPSSAGFHPPAAPPPPPLPLTSSPSHPTSSVQRPMFHVKHRSLLKLTPQPHPSRSRYFVLTLALRAFDMPLPGSPMFHVKHLIITRTPPSNFAFTTPHPSHPAPSHPPMFHVKHQVAPRMQKGDGITPEGDTAAHARQRPC